MFEQGLGTRIDLNHYHYLICQLICTFFNESVSFYKVKIIITYKHPLDI